ncbi:MAG: alkaline phosphatase PhoX [Micropruina sp.]|nr:DUF839 domain-containing protein [Micropruina sp.]
MTTPTFRWLAATVATAAVPMVALTGPAWGAAPITTGPSSSQSPYLTPSAPGVSVTSILTVGDSVNNKADGTPYRMVGIPDGLGAYDNGDDTFTVLMNHELRPDRGIVRAHGTTGAFVSKWTIAKDDLTVIKGEDLITQVMTATADGGYEPSSEPLARLCSADLPEVSAFYDAASGKGYQGRIFMNGEEAGDEGRGFAHLMDGTSYELPRLGKFSWENSIAHPGTGVKTVVVGTDDTTPGQVYVYVGEKQASGSPIERAGLTNGTLYGVAVDGSALELRAAPFAAGTGFGLQSFGDVSAWTGAELQAASVSAGVTEWLRPEDGQWDPTAPEDFYFATTDNFDGASRLWRLRFADLAQPELGGTVEAVLDGTEGQHMMDNMTISRKGRVLLQEDPGNQDYLAKVYSYDLNTDRLTEVAAHDAARFGAGAPGLLTRDEESSGVIDVSHILGQGRYLLTTQAHYALGGELVEGGQLMSIRIPWRTLKSPQGT